jgi:hypothetical protein
MTASKRPSALTWSATEPGLSRAAEVTDSDISHPGRRSPQIGRPAVVTRVPDDLMPFYRCDNSFAPRLTPRTAGPQS